MNFPAIYGIVNSSNGKIYVGSASNLRTRWNAHKSIMRKNESKSTHLQRAWNKYGEDAFQLIILATPNKGELVQQEQKWINITKSCDGFWGYNLNPSAARPPDMTGRKQSPESIRKGVESRRGYRHSDETKRLIGEGNRGKPNAFKGKKRNERARAVIQYDRDMNYIAEWRAISDAAKELNLSVSNISQCCKGKRQKTVGGFIWKYKLKN